MPQISLYIDQETLSAIEKAAEREHLSLSKWVATNIRRAVRDKYPPDFHALFGSVAEEGFQRPRDLEYTADTKREAF